MAAVEVLYHCPGRRRLQNVLTYVREGVTLSAFQSVEVIRPDLGGGNPGLGTLRNIQIIYTVVANLLSEWRKSSVRLQAWLISYAGSGSYGA